MYHFEEEDHLPTVEELDKKAKVYFQVIIDYNRELIKTMVPKEHSDKVDEMEPLESHAIKTFEEADKMAQTTLEKIHNNFPGSKVKQLEPEEQEDEYHLWVADEKGIPIAKIGVIATDYTNVVLH